MPQVFVVPASTPGADGTGPTRLDYRSVLGNELGWWKSYTVETGASGTPEPERYLILSELEDDEESVARMAGCYAYARAVGGAASSQQRRVARQGYDGGLGAVALSRPLDATLSEGDVVEISRPLPVADHLDRKGLNTHVDAALNRCVVEARLPLVGNGTGSVSLAAYPFVTRVEQTRGIYDRRDGTAAADPATLSPFPYRFRSNGATIALVPDPMHQVYGAGEAFELSVVVPGDRLIFDGSAWGYATTPGLSDDTMQAAAPLHWVRAFGMVKALQHLITVTLEDDALPEERRKRLLARYEERLPTYARAAADIASTEFPRPIQEPTPSLVGGASVSINQGVVWSGWPT